MITAEKSATTPPIQYTRVVLENAFRLYFSPLEEADRAGKTRELSRYLPGLPEQPGIPVALRWYNSPLYGFSRRPVSVYRRKRNASDITLYGVNLINDQVLNNAVQVQGSRKLELGEKVMFDVIFRASIGQGQYLKIHARDRSQWKIPNQMVLLTSSGWGRIRCPGIAELWLEGYGTLTKLYALPQDTLANLPDWGRAVQVVGMPFTQGEVDDSYYRTQETQGYAPASLSGYDAAVKRLAIAQHLQLPSPELGGVIPAGLFPPSDAGAFLGEFLTVKKDGMNASFFQVVKDCLTRTKDTAPDALQRDYVHTAQLDGWRRVLAQKMTPGNPKLSTKVVGMAMQNVATDSMAATALGYGTVDVASSASIGVLYDDAGLPITFTCPVGMPEYPYDYMVVQEMTVLFQFLGSELPMTQLYASLAERRLAPGTPENLQLERVAVHPPERMDEPHGETRKLSWKAPAQPQAYGMVARRASGLQVLNRPKVGGSGYQPYVPATPLLEKNPNASVYYLDKYGQQPLPQQVEHTQYHVIATDVFGRWSSWSSADYQTSPGPVQSPGLERVTFEQKEIIGTKVRGDLIIDFSWDWAQRSARAIRFYGCFYKSDLGPPVYQGIGLPLEEGKSKLPLEILFDAAYQPSLSAATGHTGDVVELIDPDQPPPAPIDPGAEYTANVHRYRLTVNSLEFPFSDAVPRKDYAVWAVANETVRPFTDSQLMGPRALSVYDPTPPGLELNPPTILWTTLPDATGLGRATLSWAGKGNAKGYVVWHATETALRQFLEVNGLVAQLPDASLELVERATAWEALLGSVDMRSLDPAFSRVNAQLLTRSQLEVELPGATRLLHFYRVSAVSHTNIESPRSAVPIKAAVPERVVPEMPEADVEAAQANGYCQGGAWIPGDVTGVRLTLRPRVGGAAPVGYRVFRTRDRSATEKLAFMGPPVILEGDACWKTEQVDGVTRHSYFERHPPSWFPFYYQVQAVGTHSPPTGKLRGLSAPTPAREVYVLPKGPPTLTVSGPLFNAPPLPRNDIFAIYVMSCDLPLLMRSPLGDARLQVIESTLTGDRVTRLDVVVHDRTRVTRLYSPMNPEDDISVLAGLPAGESRLVLADWSGHLSLRLFVPAAVVEALAPNVFRARSSYFIRAIDPLGRVTERQLEQPPAPLTPPPPDSY